MSDYRDGKEIRTVKNGVLRDYDYGITIGKALHNWFDGTEDWMRDVIDGDTYVYAQGRTEYTISGQPETQTFIFRILDDEHFVFEGAYDKNGNLISTSNGNLYGGFAVGLLDGISSMFGGNSVYEILLRAAFGDEELMEKFRDKE